MLPGGQGRGEREGNQENPDLTEEGKKKGEVHQGMASVRHIDVVNSFLCCGPFLHPASPYPHHFTHQGSCRVTNIQNLSSAVLKAVLLRMGCWIVQHLCLYAFPESQFIHSHATPKVAQENERSMLSGLGLWVRSCPLNLSG